MKFAQPGWTRSLDTSVVLGWATLGPIGQRLPAPGTWGSVAGLAYFFLGFRYMGVAENLLVSAIGAYLAIAFCGEAEIRLGARDPGMVILDEVVAMPLCFLGFPWLLGTVPLWCVLLCGLIVFRVYDIRKPWVINELQSLPGGWGVVLDDTAAALATCATLHLAHAIWMFF
jgi:phosphatidylglycerophosphatase A